MSEVLFIPSGLLFFPFPIFFFLFHFFLSSSEDEENEEEKDDDELDEPWNDSDYPESPRYLGIVTNLVMASLAFFSCLIKAEQK